MPQQSQQLAQTTDKGAGIETHAAPSLPFPCALWQRREAEGVLQRRLYVCLGSAAPLVRWRGRGWLVWGWPGLATVRHVLGPRPRPNLDLQCNQASLQLQLNPKLPPWAQPDNGNRVARLARANAKAIVSG